jgi:hypothetical protein
MAIFIQSGKDVMGREIGRFGRAQKMEYGKIRRAHDERIAVTNETKVAELASKFEQEVARQRKAAGL